MEQATILLSKEESIIQSLFSLFPLNSVVSILVSFAVAYFGIGILISVYKASRFKETQAQSSNEYGFLALTVISVMSFQLFKLVLLASKIAVMISMWLKMNSCDKIDHKLF